MKPIMLVPPAQAEALSDSQDDLRSDLCLDHRAPPLPWRDDENSDEPFLHQQNAQHWPSSVKSSRWKS